MKFEKRRIPDFLVREEEPNGKLKSVLSIIAHYKSSELSICSYDEKEMYTYKMDIVIEIRLYY